MNAGHYGGLREGLGTSLVGSRSPSVPRFQGTRVRSLVRDDSTCCGATEPGRHNYCTCVLQLQKPMHPEPVLCEEKSRHREKPAPEWLRICLVMPGTPVRSTTWDDPTRHGATKPRHHNYQACRAPPLLKPRDLERMLGSKRSPCNEKAAP
ncbi:hypothetical protein MJT46_009338 [Ovis ammon polii x Ovis aries]|nr:hypothetical protein MJT46_009338 [Ovis ammon polii x Ovis aries]